MGSISNITYPSDGLTAHSYAPKIILSKHFFYFLCKDGFQILNIEQTKYKWIGFQVLFLILNRFYIENSINEQVFHYANKIV